MTQSEAQRLFEARLADLMARGRKEKLAAAAAAALPPGIASIGLEEDDEDEDDDGDAAASDSTPAGGAPTDGAPTGEQTGAVSTELARVEKERGDGAGAGKDATALAVAGEGGHATELESAEAVRVAQEAVVQALAAGESVSAAAREAGVHRGTVHRWMRDGRFRTMCEQARFDTRKFARMQFASLAYSCISAIRGEIEDGDANLALRILDDMGLTREAPDIDRVALLGDFTPERPEPRALPGGAERAALPAPAEQKARAPLALAGPTAGSPSGAAALPAPVRRALPAPTDKVGSTAIVKRGAKATAIVKRGAKPKRGRVRGNPNSKARIRVRGNPNSETRIPESNPNDECLNDEAGAGPSTDADPSGAEVEKRVEPGLMREGASVAGDADPGRMVALLQAAVKSPLADRPAEEVSVGEVEEWSRLQEMKRILQITARQ